jgi:hypothetical protein
VAPGGTLAVIHHALTEVAAIDRACFDELHVLTSAAGANRLSAVLLKSGTASRLTARCRRLGIVKADILFGRGSIHTLGSATPAAIADDTLTTLRKLCADPFNEVTIVVSSYAGAIGILAHSALQLVGKPRDRFFVLDAGAIAAGGSKSHRRRGVGASRPSLVEVPFVLAEGPLLPGQSYQQLATSRRLAQRRLAYPGKLAFDGPRRTIGIDDLELHVARLQFFWMFCLATFAPKVLPFRMLCGNFEIKPDGRITVVPEHPQRAQLESVVRHIRRVFVTLYPEAADEFPLVFKRAFGPTPGLPSIMAKLNARLKRALGAGAAPYLIAGGRGTGGYRLTMPPSQIQLTPHVRAAYTQRQRTTG